MLAATNKKMAIMRATPSKLVKYVTCYKFDIKLWCSIREYKY